MKICFVTSLFGNSYNEGDKPGYFNKKDEYDYLLFTNHEVSLFRTSWNVVNINDCVPEITSNIIKSRYPKFMGWKLIKEKVGKEYDIIVYCDCYLSPIKNIEWDIIGNYILKHPSGIMHDMHKRNSYQELKAIVGARKDTKERCNKLDIFLKANHFPNNVIMPENTVFIYDPKNKALTNAFTDFWNEYYPYEKSHRDQPLWSFILWKHNLKPIFKEYKFMRNRFVQNNGKIGFNSHQYV